MGNKRLAIVTFAFAALGVTCVLADIAQAGVLYTGRARAGEGDRIECAGVNVSTVPVPIKLEILDGDGGGVVASVDCQDIQPGTNAGTCDSEIVGFHSPEGTEFDALCRITVAGFPANFVRANMVIHFSSGGAISTDGIPAPISPRVHEFSLRRLPLANSTR